MEALAPDGSNNGRSKHAELPENGEMKEYGNDEYDSFGTIKRNKDVKMDQTDSKDNPEKRNGFDGSAEMKNEDTMTAAFDNFCACNSFKGIMDAFQMLCSASGLQEEVKGLGIYRHLRKNVR